MVVVVAVCTHNGNVDLTVEDVQLIVNRSTQRESPRVILCHK